MSVELVDPEGNAKGMPPGMRTVVPAGHFVRNLTGRRADFKVVQHGIFVSGLEIEPGDLQRFDETMTVTLLP